MIAKNDLKPYMTSTEAPQLYKIWKIKLPFPSTNFAQILSSQSTFCPNLRPIPIFHCFLFVTLSPSDTNLIFPVKKKNRQIPVLILPLHAP